MGHQQHLHCICCCLLLSAAQGHNAFIRKNLNHTTFSAEPGNLYNKHSYKHSGACGSSREAQRSSTAWCMSKQL